MRDILLILLRVVFQGYTLIIILRALVSWVSVDPYHPIVRFLVSATEPLLAPLRRSLPDFGAVDISPIIAIILIQLVYIFLVRVVVAIF